MLVRCSAISVFISVSFWFLSWRSVCVCVFFFRHCVQLYQYDGNPSPGILGFVLFLKITPYCSSPIRISQTSSKADCEELVVGALFSRLHLVLYGSPTNTQQILCVWEPRITCFCVCVAFLLLTVKCNLLVSIGNSMICNDIWHKYHG